MRKLRLVDMAPYSGKRVQPFVGAKKYLSTGDLQDESLSFEEITFANRPSRADIIVSEGDILFARMQNTNKVLYVDNSLDGIIVSTGFSVHKPDFNVLNAHYLIQFLKSTSFHQQKNKLCTGAIQLAISNTGIEKILIQTPSPQEQIQIAGILRKAEVLIEQRKQSIALLDEFLKSTFADMFGNPVTNVKQFKKEKLKKYIGYLTTGGRGWNKYYSKTGERFIRSFDVQMNYISNEDAVYVNAPNNQEAKRTKIKADDILLTMTGSKIGRVATVPKEFESGYISQHVAIIRVKDIVPLYLSYYLSELNCGQYLIRKNQYGQTKPGLNFKQVEGFDILIPPTDLQSHFASIFLKTQALKGQHKASLQELENLYGSLSQQAFNGTLTLAKADSIHAYIQNEEVSIAAEPVSKYKPQRSELTKEEELQLLFITFNIFANQLTPKSEANLGEIKMEKTCHLTESLISELQFNRCPKKREFGPADFERLFRLHDYAAINNIFFFDKNASYKKYTQGEQFMQYWRKAVEQFKPFIKQVHNIINLLLPLDTRTTEILATTFAAWNNLLLKKQRVSLEAIIKEAKWHTRKEGISTEEFQQAVEFLKANNIEPLGSGKQVE